MIFPVSGRLAGTYRTRMQGLHMRCRLRCRTRQQQLRGPPGGLRSRSGRRAGEFRGVVQQIGKNLRHAAGSTFKLIGFDGRTDLQLVGRSVDRWPAGLDGAFDHRRHVDHLFAKFDLVPRDAADIEQVVHERVS